MKGEEVLAILRQAAPEHYACAWDNVGLLVGSSKKEVKRIYLALDATDEVVEQAVSCAQQKQEYTLEDVLAADRAAREAVWRAV